MTIHQIVLNIGGQQLGVKCPEGQEDALYQAAKLLENKMNAIKASGNAVDINKVIQLAALNIAYEYLQTSIDGKLDFSAFNLKMDELNLVLDQALEKAAEIRKKIDSKNGQEF